MIGPIEKAALLICDKLGWYTLKKMIKRCSKLAIVLFFIVGERRIGKTLFFQHLACAIFKMYGYQTMWIRNKKVELEDDGFVQGFLTACKRLGWADDSWCCRRDGVWTHDGSKEKTAELGEAEQVVLFQSISTFSNRRGNETPKVMMLVFDEFMPEDRKYPKNAAKGLMSLTKTVLSGREDARCFCLSNFISAANPYFVGFRIYPDETRDITVFDTKGIAIEVCRGYRCAIEEDSIWNAVYSAGNYADYATQNEDTLIQLVVKKWPTGAVPVDYAILSDGILYRCFVKDGLAYWNEYRGSKNNLKIFTKNLQEVGTGVYLMPDYMKQDIRAQTAANIIRFRNPNVMFAVLDTVFETV